VQAAGRIPASPKKSRSPARAIANEAALKKGMTGREVCSRYGERTTVHTILGRPVTGAGERNATLWSGVFAF
jgi:hypothetical protein